MSTTFGATWGPSILSAATSLFGGERANRFERSLAGRAHQIEVADLRAAGLNPILSGTGGGGAPVPSQEDTLTPAINSALTAQRMRLENKQLLAQTQLTHEQEHKARVERINEAVRGRILEQTGFDSATSALDAQRIANELAQKQLPIAQMQAEAWQLGGEGAAKLLEIFGSGATARRIRERLRSLGQLPGVRR